MDNPKKIVEEMFEAINSHYPEKGRPLLHSEYSFTSADGQRQEGPDAGIEVAEMYLTAFPDVHLDMKYMHVAGNFVIAEFNANGTHKGEIMGIAPTGRQVKIPVCNVVEVRDGKIYAEREYFDTAYLKQQLGVDEARPAAMA